MCNPKTSVANTALKLQEKEVFMNQMGNFHIEQIMLYSLQAEHRSSKGDSNAYDLHNQLAFSESTHC